MAKRTEWEWKSSKRPHIKFGSCRCHVRKSRALPVEYRIYRSPTGTYEAWVFGPGMEGDWRGMGKTEFPLRVRLPTSHQTAKSPDLFKVYLDAFDEAVRTEVRWRMEQIQMESPTSVAPEHHSRSGETGVSERRK